MAIIYSDIPVPLEYAISELS